MTGSVRAATGADLAAVEIVEAACFGPDRWTREALAGAVGGEAGRFVAVALAVSLADQVDAAEAAPAEVVGCVIVRLGGDTADLERIAVLPAERRHGVGAALLSWAVERARREGTDSLLLEVAADNQSAISFYAGHGFVEIDRRPRYYRGDVDALILHHPL